MAKQIKLTLMQEEALKEIGNLGAAQATTTLSKVVRRKIELNVPYIRVVPINKLSSIIVGPREVIASTFMKIFGDMSGSVLVLFKKKTAYALVDLMLKKPFGSTRKLEEKDISALIELSNIINNSYLSALANFLEMKCNPCTPELVLDLDYLFEEFLGKGRALESGYALIIGTEYELGLVEKAEGEFILIVKTDILERLTKLLDEKLKKRKGKIF